MLVHTMKWEVAQNTANLHITGADLEKFSEFIHGTHLKMKLSGHGKMPDEPVDSFDIKVLLPNWLDEILAQYFILKAREMECTVARVRMEFFGASIDVLTNGIGAMAFMYHNSAISFEQDDEKQRIHLFSFTPPNLVKHLRKRLERISNDHLRRPMRYDESLLKTPIGKEPMPFAKPDGMSDEDWNYNYAQLMRWSQDPTVLEIAERLGKKTDIAPEVFYKEFDEGGPYTPMTNLSDSACRKIASIIDHSFRQKPLEIVRTSARVIITAEGCPDIYFLLPIPGQEYCDILLIDDETQRSVSYEDKYVVRRYLMAVGYEPMNFKTDQ